MPTQIVLAWSVESAGTIRSAAQVQSALQAVSLYQSASADPVLGQLLGLSVASDVTAIVGTTAVRTLTLNMLEASDTLSAPPPFPCHPRTATPPTLPFDLRRSEPLSGSFFVVNGSASVSTEVRQDTKLPNSSVVQFAAQPGVYYTIAGSSGTGVTLSAPYTGDSGATDAFQEVADPIPLDRAAVYSTSDFDTNGVATSPAIAAGTGARTGKLVYLDSAGNGPFEADLTFTGRRPSPITPSGPAGIDIAVIVALYLDQIGDFENSVGQITLVELSDALPDIRSDTPWENQVDEGQMLISRRVAYLPPSYFAVANPNAAAAPLGGEFYVTTGSAAVGTSEDQTGAISGGDEITFVSQPGVRYEVSAVGPKSLTLTAVYTGINDNHTGKGNQSNVGTKGNLGATVTNEPTGASLVPATGAPPTNAELAAPLAQFLEAQTAVPPPAPPLPPATVSPPTLLSGFFTRRIQLALAGVPVVPQTIAFV